MVRNAGLRMNKPKLTLVKMRSKGGKNASIDSESNSSALPPHCPQEASSLGLFKYCPLYQKREVMQCPRTTTILDQAIRPPVANDVSEQHDQRKACNSTSPLRHNNIEECVDSKLRQRSGKLVSKPLP